MIRQYSVAALIEEVSVGVSERYPRVLVEGEVAQITVAGSGHAYLVLREPGTSRNAATLNAVCWRATYNGLSVKPKPGDRVVCRGKLGVYTQRGQVQLTIFEVRPAGEGELAKQIAERIARLTADGLLDPARKRALPATPRIIGVVASPTSAALQDFLRVSRERYPATRILLAPALTQGAEAPSSVVRAMDLLIEDGRSEVIVVTRGGGSKEDLIGFQDEQLARFVATSPIPVVAAVGHQIDTTLIDLVADVSVPTPTAAAVAVFPDGQGLARAVDDTDLALREAMTRRLAVEQQRLAALSARLRHPGERLADVRRRQQALLERLQSAMDRRLTEASERLSRAEQALPRAVNAQLSSAQSRLSAQSAALNALSPLAVLSRGFALVTGPDGVLSDATQVAVDSEITVRLRRGRLTARVLSADAAIR